MGIVHGEIAGAPVMICRLSFSGEMAFEVYCGAGHGTHVWNALIEAGKPFGMVPYGLEALGTLRIEKGHVTGAEIDGRTTARDLHLDWMLSKKKPFVGSMTMDREGLVASDRVALVGVISLDNRPLAGGAHIVEQLDEAAPQRLDRPYQRRLLFAGARQIHRAGHGQGRQVAARHARLRLRPAAQALWAGRDRQPPFLRPGREPHAWLSSSRRWSRCGSPAPTARCSAAPASRSRRRRPGSIVQAAAFPGEERTLIAAISDVTGLALPDGAGGGVVAEGKSAFGIAPGRFLVVDQNEGLGIMLKAAVLAADRHHHRPVAWPHGDPHFRTESRMGAGEILRHRFCAARPFPKAPAARPPITTSSRRSSAPAPQQFDLYVFRSFARSFWTALCHASEEVGYEVR